MQDSKPLITQVAQEIARSSTTSPTAAGPAEPTAGGRAPAQREARAQQQRKPTDAHIDALNEVFALLRINYHNQYYKAYSDTQVLNQIKKLWLESLVRFSPEAILLGVRRVIENSEFLPTLKTMIDHCERESHEGLPEAHVAYIEACQAPSPKSAYAWSHPAVYHAGRMADWYFLGNNTEKTAFPVFERHYKQLCERVIAGETLAAPEVPALPETIETPLSKDENRERLEALRKDLGL